ncbi:MAG: metalloregulator ArsR/SmtB family transcription factor [Firmicutes bacterium]|jgi:ArsR family transcriptional regulator|nr:metalloregulator ArsR/SmtB family transcription factor [Bacillota bacterium]
MILGVFKVFSDENRLRIYNLLRKKDLCVCEIEALLEINQSNLSRHLSKMKNIGVLDFYKDQQFIYYRIADDFNEKYKNLLIELDNVLDTEEKFLEDKNNLDIYLKSGYNSDDIKLDRSGVVKHIKSCKCSS